jgi:glycosyltransferase involved in cell wall biosynthesis
VKNILQYPIRYTADYLIACSKSSGEWLFGSACKKDNFFIFNNAIDAKTFIFDEDIRTDKRKEFQIEDKFIIGHIGRFTIPKNHEFLIDIFKAVYDRNNNAILMLIGDGELRSLIEKKVNNLGLTNNVIFTGLRSDISELLQVMDVFVFPSLYEGLPVTLVEAQAAGLPCVISDRITGDVKITNLVEYISLDDNIDYWAEKIMAFAVGFERKNTYKEINEVGYDIESIVKRYQEFYISII